MSDEPKKTFRRKSKPSPKLIFPGVKLGEEPRELRVTGKARRLAEAKMLVMEWAVMSDAEVTPRSWLMEKYGYTLKQVTEVFTVIPVADWYDKRKDLQDHITAKIVKRHVDFVAEMNDQHIAAAKLGMARAIEFMSKMSVEEAKDKYGRPYFRGFRTIDLANSMLAIEKAQKVQRMALGLNTDEGSINLWQTINKTINVGGDVTEEQVGKLEELLAYDDIKALIATERAKNQKAIDVESKPA